MNTATGAAAPAAQQVATNTVTQTRPPQQSLVAKMAARFGVDADKMLNTLKATAFRQRDVNKVVTNEQMMALLVVADQYNLNPWTKEIFAFEDKNMGIIPVVSVDGWTRIINSHDDYNGIEFRYSPTFETMVDGKPCPEWCEAVIYHKNRERPTVIREYLDEVYVPKRNGYAGPWQSHTKRMLRHKTLIQGARVAFGFAGIYDEDEAQRILQAEVVSDSTSRAANVGFADFTQRLENVASGGAGAAGGAGSNGGAGGAAGETTTVTSEVVDAEFSDVPVVDQSVIAEEPPPPTFDEVTVALERAATLDALDEQGTLLALFKTDERYKDAMRRYMARRSDLIDK